MSPKKLAKFLSLCDGTKFAHLLASLRTKPGSDFTNSTQQTVLQAISGGIVPSYSVKAGGGARLYSFAPYTGTLLTSDEEKTILDKARALVACLRYGNEAAAITRIRNPLWILRTLMDPGRQHRVGPHDELKNQYGMLVGKQLGRVIQSKSRGYYFQLLPTTDNLRACQIAAELLQGGELLAQKDPAAGAAVNLVTGTVDHPLREVRIAKKKRAARADDLADLVERLQSVD